MYINWELARAKLLLALYEGETAALDEGFGGIDPRVIVGNTAIQLSVADDLVKNRLAEWVDGKLVANQTYKYLIERKSDVV